jgi:hypothetical protein
MRRSSPVISRTLAALTVLSVCAGMAHAAINFSPVEPVAIPPNPDFFAIGDLNRDGLDDLVIVSGASDQVSVLLGSRTNPTRFLPLTTMTFGKKLRGPALGDLNGNGNLDLAVADEGGARGVWILLGRGDGTFATPSMVNVGRNPYAIAIGNFDGRNNNDLAVIDRRQDVVLIRLNDGGNPPRFAIGPQLNVGGSGGPEAVFAVDLNADGNLDVAVLNQGGPRVKDIAVFFFLRLVQGVPVFDGARNFLVGERPEDIKAVDLNGDGTPDFVMLNRVRTRGNSTIESVITDPVRGVLLPPASTEVGCPFFTGGLFCRTRAIAPADYDGNGTIDLAVTLTDPRQTFINTDALQAFSGRGDGDFVAGAVYTVFKRPQALGAGDFTGDGMPDVAVGATRRVSVQAFVNVSTPGEKGNGENCLFGEECVSGRCTDGVCCATQCNPGEICNLPGHEGVCTPVPEAIPCDSDIECATGFCRNGFCCDRNCEPPGRCDLPDFEGLCIDLLPDGDECFDDIECFSGFCTNGVCCKERCENGFCDEFGICTQRLPNGEPCDFDEECASGVCDVFDGICCNRRCDPFEEFCDPSQGGTCQPFDAMRPNGQPCTFGSQCLSGFCVNGVCCVTPECPAGQICRPNTGICGAGLPNGSACTDPNQCSSGFCVNRICCGVSGCPFGQFCQPGTGQCGPGRPDGNRCTDGSQCSSGFCVNGVCCGVASCPSGQFCQLDTGQCGPGRPDGDRCMDGSECNSGFCVNGVCCDTPLCPTGEFCQPETGICGPGLPDGQRCTDGSQCSSGFCVNGVCCGSPSCPSGQFCQVSSGMCGPGRPTGDTCTDGSQCNSGFCVNGVCCSVAMCPSGEVCQILTGQCGPPVTPTPTGVPTRIPSSTPIGGTDCGPDCPPNKCINGQCVFTSSSGGCSLGDGGPTGRPADLLVALLLPAVLWSSRRWALRRRAVAPAHRRTSRDP